MQNERAQRKRGAFREATGRDEYDQSTHRNSGLVWLEARKAHQPSALYGLLYLHPNADRSDWQQLRSSLEAAAHTELPIFLLGDFNIHSPRWGDHRAHSSRLAAHLDSACEEFDWDVLNELHAFGEVTHQERRGNHFGPGRDIDLGLSSHNSWVQRFSVLRDSGLHSDHFPLLLTVQPDVDSQPRFVAHEPVLDASGCARPAWNLRNADWNEFAALVGRFLTESSAQAVFQPVRSCPACSSLPLQSDSCACSSADSPQSVLEAAWSVFHLAVMDAAHLCFRIRRPSLFSKSWWSYPGADLPAAYRAWRAAVRAHVNKPRCLIRRKEMAVALREWRRIQHLAREWAHAELCAAIQSNPAQAINWPAWKRATDHSGSADASLFSVPHPTLRTLPRSAEESLDHVAQHFHSVTRLPTIPISPRHRRADADRQAATDAGPISIEWAQGDQDEPDDEESPSDVAPDDPADGHPEASSSSHHRAVLGWIRDHAERIRSEKGPAELEPLFTPKSLRDLLDGRRPTSPGPDHIPLLFLRYGGAALRSGPAECPPCAVQLFVGARSVAA